jgi:hypothetical protein
MPVIMISGGIANAMRCMGSTGTLCPGNAGVTQHPTALHIDMMPPCWSPGHAGHGWSDAMPPDMDCICAAIATLDATGPRSPNPKARITARTRNRLTSEPSMHDQHTTRRKGCQGTRATTTGAFGRSTGCLFLLLLAVGVTPAISAETPNTLRDSLRTEDHVHVDARRAGDAVLVTVRIDPGYHINANPASNEYLIPTSVAFDSSASPQIAYPPAMSFKAAFSDEPLAVYEGTAVITATFPAGTLNRVHEAGFTLTAQACTPQICLPPADISGKATW